MLKRRHNMVSTLLFFCCAVLASPSDSAAQSGNLLYEWHCATEHAPWTARVRHAMLGFDNKLWILGGDPNDVWCSIDGSVWNEATDNAAWPKRSYFRATVFEDKMWIMGGIEDYTYNDVWYSENGADWTQATANAAWPARYGFGLAVFAGRLWVLGGLGFTPGNDVWSSADGVNWTLVTQSAPWMSRDELSAVVLDGKLWVVGGQHWEYGVEQDLNDAWYTVDGVNWTQAVNHAPWMARMSSVATLDRSLWLAGGYYTIGTGHDIHYDYLNDVWHSMDGITWVQETNAPWVARMGHATAVFDGKFWISGGCPRSSAGGCFNDVWYLSTDGGETAHIEASSVGWIEQGSPLTLTAVVPGLVEPATYQWTKDAVPLLDNTSNPNRIDAVTLDAAGWYGCQVTDGSKTRHDLAPVLIQVFPEGSLPAASPIVLFLTAVGCVAIALVRGRRRRS